ncbi:zinc ribbon domain-containing protein [Glaciihabitans sp. dw_435]|uniref:zinc ribbon domain-containing protein n=1 Tax=Glaciihabitans sp. dw_435 TaxID=2720081 RepID=UPI0021078CB4|nr:hypothetical protein [Glaciihabitans sp. dw_435]
MALKANPADQALLLDLQELDTRLAQINYRAKSLPQHAALQSLAAERMTLGAVLAEQGGAVEDVTTELKRIESDVSVVEARIKRDDERLQVTSSVKDVQALELELVALKKRQFDLEEIELVVMEKLEEATTAYDATKVLVDALDGRVAEAEAERDAAMVSIDEDRTNAEANRSAIAEKIPADLLALYDHQRARYGLGASLLRGGVSGASGVKLHESDMVSIRSAALDDVILCPDSSAILVRTSESGL